MLDVDTFCEQQVSPNTARAYRQDLKRWNAFLAGREPTREIVLGFRQHLEAELHPNSASRVFNTARVYYRWIGGDNAFASIKSPRRPSHVTPIVPEDSVIDRLVEACNEPRDAAIIALLLNGLRASEVGSLETTDWTWSETYSCHIIRVLGKGFKERLVPANSQTSERVSRYLNGRQRASTWLLGPSQTTLRAIEYVLEKYCERAGIAGVSPHSLRHAYATRLARAHVGVFQLQQLLGHASPATTQRYITLDMGDLVEAARKDPRHDATERKLRLVI